MLPLFTANNLSDISLAHAKHAAKINLSKFSCRVQPEDFADIIVSEFGTTAAFPPGMPVLGPHVGHVCNMISEKEMNRIHAGRSIAVMTDEHSIWDVAIGKFVSITVGCDGCFTNFVPDFSVAFTAFSSSPQYTSAGGCFAKTLTESLADRYGTPFVAAYVGTEPTLATFDVTRINLNQDSADFTDLRDCGMLTLGHDLTPDSWLCLRSQRLRPVGFSHCGTIGGYVQREIVP